MAKQSISTAIATLLDLLPKEEAVGAVEKQIVAQIYRLEGEVDRLRGVLTKI